MPPFRVKPPVPSPPSTFLQSLVTPARQPQKSIKMSTRSLPTETLEQIFSSNLEQPQLAIPCRVSKRFNNIVKPFLYRSITLQSIRQANQFKNSSEEDVKLVEEVRIIGKGDFLQVKSRRELRRAFAAMSEMERPGKEAGVVRKLVEGEIVNPAQVKRLFIHQSVEDHGLIPFDGYRVTPQVFSSLTDLSLISHRGGWNGLSELVKPSVLPNLERFFVYGPNWCEDENNRLPRSRWVLTSEGLIEVGLPPECRLLEGFVALLPPRQLGNLKLLVSSSFEFLRRFPSILHLAILDDDDGYLHNFEKHILVHTSTFSITDAELNRAFDRLARLASDTELSLKYLALPSGLEQELTPYRSLVLNHLIDLGVSVHFDGELGSVIAPPSFFEFRKKEEEEEEARRREEEAGRE